MNSVTSNAVAASIAGLNLSVSSAALILNDNDVNLKVRTYGKIALFSVYVKRTLSTSKIIDITAYECVTFYEYGYANNIKAALTWGGQTTGEMAIQQNNGKKIEIATSGQASGSLVAFLK